MLIKFPYLDLYGQLDTNVNIALTLCMWVLMFFKIKVLKKIKNGYKMSNSLDFDGLAQGWNFLQLLSADHRSR